MNGLANGWAAAEYGEVADIKLGKMLDKAKNKGQPTRYLRNINVRWGAFDLSDILSMRMTSDERRQLSIWNGDILVCEGGEPGRSAVWDRGPTELTFQKALMRLRSHGGIESRFLAAFLRLSCDNGQLERYFTGTTIKHLPQTALSRVVLPLAPTREQKRIADRIDSLSVKSFRARDQLDRIPRLVEKYKQAILRAAFRGELTRGQRTAHQFSDGELLLQELSAGRLSRRRSSVPTRPLVRLEGLPKEWAVARVEDVCSEVVDGTHHTPHYIDAGVPFISVKDIRNSRIDFSDCKFISLEEHEELSKRCNPKPGDVLITKSGTIGRCAVVQEDTPTFSLFVSVALLRPATKVGA